MHTHAQLLMRMFSQYFCFDIHLLFVSMVLSLGFLLYASCFISVFFPFAALFDLLNAGVSATGKLIGLLVPRFLEAV